MIRLGYRFNDTQRKDPQPEPQEDPIVKAVEKIMRPLTIVTFTYAGIFTLWMIYQLIRAGWL